MSPEIASLYISIAALMTSVVGWFVVHALAMRTQKQALINSLTNEARQTITDAIRYFHEWCIEIICKVSAASVDEVLIRAAVPHARRDRVASIRELIVDQSAVNWARRLEEYECLFPETASVRVELLSMYHDAFDALGRYAEISEHNIAVAESPEQAQCLEALHDLLGLTWDLLVHVQNKSIGKIAGHKVPDRQVQSDKLPHLVLDRAGNLKIRRQVAS